MWKIGILYLLLINLAGFLSMGIDKRKAQKQKWRIPEKVLFLFAILGGSAGSLLGMYTFRHKTKHRQFVIGIPVILVLQLILAGFLIYRNITAVNHYTGIGMGTVVTADVYGRDSKQAVEELPALITELNDHVLSWREPESSISYLNQQLQEEKDCRLYPEEQAWLTEAWKLCEDSGGALDITLRPVLDLWGIEGEHPAIPDGKVLQETLEKTGYTKLHISEDGNLTADQAGMTLDLGALGKGIACDKIAERLETMKISGAVVSIGGSILTYGKKPDGSAWNIGIQDPRGEQGTAVGYLKVMDNTVVSTSGDYEKYFMENGVRYHHIMDPVTGYPADSGLVSVTVLCPSGIDSDGLSTACFVLGREKSVELLEKYGAEAVFITTDKKIYLTDGVTDAFQLVNPEYSIVSE